jgi:hypothetical protein
MHTRAALAVLLISFIAVSGAVHVAGYLGNDFALKTVFEVRASAYPEGIFVPDFAISPDRGPPSFDIGLIPFRQYVIGEAAADGYDLARACPI